MTGPSKLQLVGQLQSPGKRPESVTFIGNEKPILTDAEQAAGLEWVDGRYPERDVRRYGALGVADDTVAIENAILVAQQSSADGQGQVVRMPVGTFLISNTITLPNRVVVAGANGRGTVIKPHSSFTDDYMFHAVNGTSSMFGSRLEDIYIDARGFNMTAVIWSQAWQDTCGMRRVVVQWDGTTPSGLRYTDGYGGAWLLPIWECEFFGDSTAANDVGILIEQVSLVGGFALDLRATTINGSVTNPLSIGIRMVNDSAFISHYHVEYVVDAISMEGAGHLTADHVTGSSNGTTNLVNIGASADSRISCRNLFPNGATGSSVVNNVSGRNVLASDGVVTSYEFPISKFSTYVSADINNVTGNGTTYTVIFNTEVFDEDNEYDVTTGIFTAKRAGMYYLSAFLELNLPLGSTIASMQILTTNRAYEVYRGNPNPIRDTGNNITVGGCVLADMDDGETARVTIAVSGIGADTVDVLQDESQFMGHYMSR